MVAADYEGQAHIAFMPQTEFTHFNVIARLRDEQAASSIVATLRGTGFPAGDVSVLGAAGDAVHTGSGLTELDEWLLRGVVRDVLEGALAGGVCGAVLGLVLSALPQVHHTVAAAAASGYALAAALGAVVGIVSGGLVGGVAGLDRSQAGSDTYGDQMADSSRVVGVHASSPTQQAEICEILRRSGAFGLRTFADGEEPSL